MTPAPRGRSLVWLVTGAFLLAAVVGAVLQGLVAYMVVRPIEAREARARAELAASSIAGLYAAAPVAPRGADLDSLLARQRTLHGLRPAVVFVRRQDGTLVTAPPELVHFASRWLPDSMQSADARRTEVLARRRLENHGQVLGEMLVMRRVPRGPGPTEPAFGWLLYLPIAAVLSVVLAFLLVRLLARRLRSLEALAGRVAAGDLSARVDDPNRDEIGRVAGQLDRMAERLAAARETVEMHEQQRRQLFADITHELATPLTSIRAAAETLLDPHVPLAPEERTRYVRGVLDESRRLDRLIRDLFELARLEAGATPLQLERLDWAALCRNTIERFGPRYAAAHLALEWKNGAAEAWVQADGLRLEQALDNLLVNALRYVPAGGHVHASLERVAGPRMRWRLRVDDDGPGLPPEELSRVFERFYRGSGVPGNGKHGNGSDIPVGDTRSARETAVDGGSGLGLAIVREIVERHGGAVRARGVSPHGLAIEVELPSLD